MKLNLRKFFHRPSRQDALFLACESVQQNVQHAVQFLKERLTSFGAFQQMPWYLVIGNKASGKTQLLEKSELPFLDQEKFAALTPSGMETQGGVNWWFSPAAVLIDVPGAYLEESEALTPMRAAWFELLQQIRRYRFRRPLNGIILTISVKSLQKGEMLFLRTRVQEVLYRLKQKLPIYIVITQMDALQGFYEYFDDLGKNERDQLCGVTLPLSANIKANLVENFSKEFESLMTNLHQRVLWRVHHEREPQRRKLILNFPHQLNSLKENLKQLIYDFSSMEAHTAVRGVYFTSSILSAESENAVDQIGETIGKHFALMPVASQAAAYRPQQAFFIKSLFEQKIFPESRLANDVLQNTATRQQDMIRWGVLGLSGIILFSLTLYFSKQYQQQTHHLNSATTALSDYKLLSLTFNTQNLAIDKLLPALDALHFALSSASQANLPWLLKFQLHHQGSLADSIQRLYDHELQTQLIPQLRAQVAQQLKSGGITDSAQLYALLKIYLMLGDPTHQDKAFLTHWFYQDWKNPLIDDKKFQQHLNAAIEGQMPVIPGDAALVQQARASLNALPYEVLSNAILKNETIPTPGLPFALENADHSFILPKTGVSPLYTPEGASKTASQINDALFSAVNGNWVLGNKVASGLSGKNVSVLQKTLMKDYESDYTEAWQQFLSQIKLKPLPNLEAVDAALQELSSNNSPLVQIVNLVQINNAHQAAFETFNNLPTKSIILNLQQVEILVHKIVSSKNQDETALFIAQNIAKQKGPDPLMQLMDAANAAPLPVKEWLYTIANLTRDLIFEKASRYAWSQWQTQVLPLCHGALDNRYPFDRTAKEDVTLSNFARFFERGGIFNQFFMIYLSPFVDKSSAKWQWKNIDGGVFDHDLTRLSQFERANIIQMLFFNHKNQLTTSFSLDNKAYNWPINTAHLTVKTGDDTSVNATGAWSIFRLIDQGTLKPQADGQTYDIWFNTDDGKTKTVLTAAPLNPFIPGAMEQFRCP